MRTKPRTGSVRGFGVFGEHGSPVRENEAEVFAFREKTPEMSAAAAVPTFARNLDSGSGTAR
ncbi:hypothetical protein [Lentzea jiangxiensis]|uniref:hypothetical protein n=1 Tax=Lentzea jiangxiensis TaxID=641025 RepID=UPI00115F8161|nr:hypothetical protein [Lentzea jiangxiensis]